MTSKRALFTCVAILTVIGCNANKSANEETISDAPLEDVLGIPDSAVVHLGAGVVRSISPSRTSIVIRHSAIDSFMSAMTMPFPVVDSTVVDGIERGDSVSFELSVRGSIINITSMEVVE